MSQLNTLTDEPYWSDFTFLSLDFLFPHLKVLFEQLVFRILLLHPLNASESSSSDSSIFMSCVQT